MDSSSCESINSYCTAADNTSEPVIADDISSLTPDLLLYRAAAARNLPVMLEALGNGAKLNWVNQDEEGQLPLHQGVRSVSGAVVE